jgi:hypothetical protein
MAETVHEQEAHATPSYKTSYKTTKSSMLIKIAWPQCLHAGQLVPEALALKLTVSLPANAIPTKLQLAFGDAEDEPRCCSGRGNNCND